MPVDVGEHLARDLEDEFLEPVGEAAHERPVGVAHQHLARLQRPDAVVVVEERLPARLKNRATDSDGRRRISSASRSTTWELPRTRARCTRLELQVDLGRLEHRGGQRAAAQADQRIGVVALPQLDALLRRQA